MNFRDRQLRYTTPGTKSFDRVGQKDDGRVGTRQGNLSRPKLKDLNLLPCHVRLDTTG